ncbi:MAG: hypothetical protein WCA77_02520 [Thermoplasmata archaeon]
MDAQAQSWQVPTAPAYPNYAMARQPSWKVRGGILKMFGIITEGIGILVSGLSIGYLVSVLNPTGVAANSVSNETGFLNMLEVGIIISGIGLVFLGIGMYAESLHN